MKPVLSCAVEVVRVLRDAGHEACFAGGCVRDHLLGMEPKDYDIATSARPEEVEALFRNTIGVGKQFGVILVVLGGHSFDVATFRSDGAYSDGRHPREVVFSSAKEDVLRRDFTINGLLMDPLDDSVIDYVQGRADLEAGIVRTIGAPEERFREDHLRILRAVRFACRLGFQIEDTTKTAMRHLADLAGQCSAERIFGELERMLSERAPQRAMKLLEELGLLHVVLPEVADTWHNPAPGRLTSRECSSLTVGERKMNVLIHLSGGCESALSWAVILNDLGGRTPVESASRAQGVLKRLRASKSLMKRVAFLVTNRDRFLFACRVSSARRRLLGAHPDCNLVRQFIEAERSQATEALLPLRGGEVICAELPAPLLGGKDLLQLGVPKGRPLGRLMKRMRYLQLQGRLLDAREAEVWVKARLTR